MGEIDPLSPEDIRWAPQNKREARAWVRVHWQAFMRRADVPDLMGCMPDKSDELIADVFSDESRRLADRLEPRRSISTQEQSR